MDKQEILILLKKQRDNLLNSSLKCYKNRKKTLKLLYKNIIEMKNEIFEALKLDLNKSEVEAYMSEIGLVLSEISYMIKHCRKFAQPKRLRTSISHFHSKSYKLPCPYGVVLIMSPWNYPFMLTLEPLVDAITAGNSVVLKPSNRSPHVTSVIDKLIKKTFSPEQVFTVLGGREETQLLLDQDFDYIFYNLYLLDKLNYTKLNLKCFPRCIIEKSFI